MLTSAINKYGWENIQHIELCFGLTKEEAEQKERKLILEHKTNLRKHGYNIELGGYCSKEIGIRKYHFDSKSFVFSIKKEGKYG